MRVFFGSICTVELDLDRLGVEKENPLSLLTKLLNRTSGEFESQPKPESLELSLEHVLENTSAGVIVGTINWRLPCIVRPPLPKNRKKKTLSN